jgi:hypothetical protein
MTCDNCHEKIESGLVRVNIWDAHDTFSTHNFCLECKLSIGEYLAKETNDIK